MERSYWRRPGRAAGVGPVAAGVTGAVASVTLALYALIVVGAYLAQRRLMYFPDPGRTAPAQAGLPGVEERVLKTPDGASIVVWYGKAKPGAPTLLYFHGNGGALVNRAPRFERFMSQGWGVYMMAYRGYGGSTGNTTEAAIVADARLAYGALVLEGVEPASIIIYGESLGTGVAARIATERPAGGLILEAPFTSAVAIGKRAYPFLPVRLVMSDRYETDKVIKQVKMPLLVLHGEKDRIIPVDMARTLMQLANEPKRLMIFPNGDHSDLYVNDNNALETVKDWIAGLKL